MNRDAALERLNPSPPGILRALELAEKYAAADTSHDGGECIKIAEQIDAMRLPRSCLALALADALST